MKDLFTTPGYLLINLMNSHEQIESITKWLEGDFQQGWDWDGLKEKCSTNSTKEEKKAVFTKYWNQLFANKFF